MNIINWYWENNDIIVESDTGEEYRLINPCVTNISFGDLEYQAGESVTVELTLKYEAGND